MKARMDYDVVIRMDISITVEEPHSIYNYSSVITIFRIFSKQDRNEQLHKVVNDNSIIIVKVSVLVVLYVIILVILVSLVR